MKKWKFSISFQICAPYNLKNKVCNIHKYRTYNRDLRVFGHPFSGKFKSLSQPFSKLFRRARYRSLTSYRGNRSETQIPLTILLALPKRKEVTLSDQNTEPNKIFVNFLFNTISFYFHSKCVIDKEWNKKSFFPFFLCYVFTFSTKIYLHNCKQYVDFSKKERQVFAINGAEESMKTVIHRLHTTTY